MATVYRETFTSGYFCELVKLWFFTNINFANLYTVSTHLQILPFDHTLSTFSHTWTRQEKRRSKWIHVSEDTMFIKRYGCSMEKKPFLLTI